MRRGVTIFILVTVVVLGFAVHSVWTLLGLLVATGREDAILRGELPAPNSSAGSDRAQLIPKIIHQTYINESIPVHWKGPQQTCIDLHPDYEYKVRPQQNNIQESTDSTSSGPIRRPASSSPTSTRGSSRRSTATPTPSSAPTRFDTLCCTTSVVSTLTWTMYVQRGLNLRTALTARRDATVALTLSSRILLGSAAPFPPVSPTMLWAPCPATRSSSRPSTR